MYELVLGKEKRMYDFEIIVDGRVHSKFKVNSKEGSRLLNLIEEWLESR